MKVYIIGSTRPDGTPVYWHGGGSWREQQHTALAALTRSRAATVARYIQERPLLYGCMEYLATPLCIQAQALEVETLPPLDRRI